LNFVSLLSIAIDWFCLAYNLSFLFLLPPLAHRNESSDSSFYMVAVIPTFALNLGLRELSSAASNRNPGLDFSNANSDGNHVFSMYIFLAVEAVVLYILAFYLENVFPSGYGVKKHPFFLCQPRTWSKSIRDKEEQTRLDDIEMVTLPRKGSRRSGSFRRGSFRRASVQEPFDVMAERQLVAESIEKNTPGVFIKNLRKVFKSSNMEIVAVDNLSIGIGNGECLGFLGHSMLLSLMLDVFFVHHHQWC
jgi:hypothetical protein